MRILLALFFLLNVPVVVSLATIFYGGISSKALKNELAKANVYSTLTDGLKQSLNESDTSEDVPPLFFSVFEERLTSSYVQGKTENFIDDTSSWLKGKTSTPPVLSFKEIKEDIMNEHPTLLADLEKSMDEVKTQSMGFAGSAEGGTEADLAAMQEQTNMIQSLIKSDFSFPVGEKLTTIKQGYQTLQIAFPILTVLLILSLVGIVLLSKTTTSKLRWIGILLAISAVYGFAAILLQNFILSAFQNAIPKQDESVKLIAPVFSQMMSLFVSRFGSYQGMVNTVFIALSILFLAASFIIKPQMMVSTKKTSPTRRK